MTYPLDGLREIKPETKALDSIPLIGAPPFPWGELAARLAKSFECDPFKIEPGHVEWRSKDTLFENLAGALRSVTLSIPTLEGEAYWVIPEQELILLENALLTKDMAPLTHQDQSIRESFYQFLILETLYAIDQTSFDKTLIPIFVNDHSPPSIDALCMDINLTVQDRSFRGRFIVTPTLRHSLVKYFTRQGPSEASQELAKIVEIPVHLEIGRTQLTVKEWKEIGLGDFLLLDSCLLDEDDMNGTVLLTVNNKAAFRGELSDGNINILEIL